MTCYQPYFHYRKMLTTPTCTQEKKKQVEEILNQSGSTKITFKCQ